MEKKTVYSLTLTKPQQDSLRKAWKENAQTPSNPYVTDEFRLDNCIILIYQSGKVVFQGKDAEIYASPFLPQEQVTFSFVENKQIPYPQCGSDEVGTGDYFGPVCVCASIVHQKDISFLEELGVKDSKKLTDDQIQQIAPQLMRHFTHSLLILKPEKYNDVHEKDNMNAIKAKLHNQAFLNLKKKQPLPAFCVVDQFTPEKSYYRYLKDTPEVFRSIHFETHAEDTYYAVAVGSIISRYAFLKEMEQMERQYDMSFQKGGGHLADQCAITFVEKYGFERLHEVAKMHFKNTERVKENCSD